MTGLILSILRQALVSLGLITAAGVRAAPTSAQLDTLLGSTRGSVAMRGASGWTILAPGTSGDVVTSQGAGADPHYATPSVGGGGGGGFLGFVLLDAGHLAISQADAGKIILLSENAIYALPTARTNGDTYRICYTSGTGGLIDPNGKAILSAGGSMLLTVALGTAGKPAPIEVVWNASLDKWVLTLGACYETD